MDEEDVNESKKAGDTDSERGQYSTRQKAIQRREESQDRCLKVFGEAIDKEDEEEKKEKRLRRPRRPKTKFTLTTR
jgi:hypothetical protein